MASVPLEYKLYHQDDVVKWGVKHLSQRETPEPHVVCALCDMVPLRDGEISVPEMRTILTLSGTRAREQGQQDRRVIPVSRALKTSPPPFAND